ncbi:MAG: tetratricopeptide repeat protein [Spirochaetaceae bacterium]
MTQESPDPERKKEELTLLSKAGYQYLRENMYREARENFEKILEVEPENNYALVGMGDLHRKRGECKKAIPFYKRCLEHHPENNYALFGLADCYKAIHHYHKAIEVWEEYLKLDGENVTVLTRVADAYRKVQNLQRSNELYQKVLELEPDNAYALIGLGHLYYDFRKFGEAAKYWSRMYELRGDRVDIRVLTSLGNCYRKLKEFDRALTYFRHALDREPDNFYALFGIADCYRGLQRPKEALAHWNRILMKDRGNKVILTRAGDAYRSLGDLETAEEYYKKALDIEFDVYAVLGLALIQKARGKFEDASQALEELVTKDPKNPRLYGEAARCLAEMNEPERALSVIKEARSQGAKSRRLAELEQELRSQIP